MNPNQTKSDNLRLSLVRTELELAIAYCSSALQMGVALLTGWGKINFPSAASSWQSSANSEKLHTCGRAVSVDHPDHDLTRPPQPIVFDDGRSFVHLNANILTTTLANANINLRNWILIKFCESICHATRFALCGCRRRRCIWIIYEKSSGPIIDTFGKLIFGNIETRL